MPVNDRSFDAISAAVAILTAQWSESQSTDLGLDVLLGYVAEDDLSDPELVLGALQVGLILLVKLENAGLDPLTVLQDIARRYRPGESAKID